MNVPPPLISFPSYSVYEQALGSEVDGVERDKLNELYQRGLPPIVSTRSLAVLFGYSARFIQAMIRRPSRYYRTFEIRSHSKTRVIHAPRVALKVVQSWFGHYLSRSVTLNDAVHGFVPERSTFSAAQVHCGSSCVLSLDIRDFFPSVSWTMVFQSLCDLGYNEAGATLIASLMTLSGKLPQGSPASPVLANLAFQRTDLCLGEFASNNQLKYTRYADDLTFSSTSEITGNTVSAIIGEVTRNGWRVASEKTTVSKGGDRHVVLGLVIGKERPRLPKRYRNKIRAMRHLLDSDKVAAADKPRLMGHVAYATSVGD